MRADQGVADLRPAEPQQGRAAHLLRRVEVCEAGKVHVREFAR
ncbi:hypothetical protein [Methylorubrum aminovorans]